MAPRGLLKVEKCKLDEIVPKKPKFSGRRPSLFLRDGSNGFSWSENDEELDFWRILWEEHSLRRASRFHFIIHYDISLFGDFRVPYLFFHTSKFDKRNPTWGSWFSLHVVKISDDLEHFWAIRFQHKYEVPPALTISINLLNGGIFSKIVRSCWSLFHRQAM
jgi:hypothetical protein